MEFYHTPVVKQGICCQQPAEPLDEVKYVRDEQAINDDDNDNDTARAILSLREKKRRMRFATEVGCVHGVALSRLGINFAQLRIIDLRKHAIKHELLIALPNASPNLEGLLLYVHGLSPGMNRTRAVSRLGIT